VIKLRRISKFFVILLALQSLSVMTSWGAQTPSITTQPASANPALGSSFTLNVQASVSDGGTLSYRWRYRPTTSDTATNLSDTSTSTNVISGSTSSTLRIDSVTAANSGLYSVVVTNTLTGASSSATSSEGVVYVLLANEDFQGSSLVNPSDWLMTYKSAYDQVFPPCLTAGTASLSPAAADNTSRSVNTSSMSGCTYASATGTGHNSIASVDSNTAGQGALRITSSANNQSSFILYDKSLSTQNGLDISFNAAMWGSTILYQQTVNSVVYRFAADGFTFFLKDGQNTSTTPGASGGSLGYGSSVGTPGIASALFGVGIDGFGNFSGRNFGGTDCYDSGNLSSSTYWSTITRGTQTTSVNETFTAGWYQGSRDGNHASQYANGTYNTGNQIVLRGPSGSSLSGSTRSPSNVNGYCPISANSPPPTLTTLSQNSSSTQVNSTYVADGIWTTRNSSNTHLYRILIDGKSIATPKIYLYIDGTLTATVNAPGQYKNSETFKFGFTGSTGGANQKIDIWATRVNTYTGITAPDAPTGVTVTQGSGLGTEVITWSHNGAWGLGEAAENGTATRSFVATIYDTSGNNATNYSCSVSATSGVPANTCTINNVPGGTYVVRVVAINRSGLSSVASTISSSFTSNGDVVVASCSGVGSLVNGGFENLPTAAISEATSSNNTNTPGTWHGYAGQYYYQPRQILFLYDQSDNDSNHASRKLSGWSTTEADHFTEIQRQVAGYQQDGTHTTGNYYDYYNVAPSAGSYFAELNANATSTLYESVATLPGSTIRWSLKHRGRAFAAGGTDTMYVKVGATLSSLDTQTTTAGHGDIKKYSAQAGHYWETTSTSSTYSTTSDTFTSNTGALTDSIEFGWTRYDGAYVVPAGQTSTIFAFQGTGGIQASIGNFLDDIQFSPLIACPATFSVVAGRTTTVNPFDVNLSGNANGNDAEDSYGWSNAYVTETITATGGSVSRTSYGGISNRAIVYSAPTTAGRYSLDFTISNPQGDRSRSTYTINVVPDSKSRAPSDIPIDPRTTSYNLNLVQVTTATTNVLACLQQSDASGTVISGALRFDVGTSGSTDTLLTYSRETVTVSNDRSNSETLTGTLKAVNTALSTLRIYRSDTPARLSSVFYIRFSSVVVVPPLYNPTNCTDSLSPQIKVLKVRPIPLTQIRSFTVLPKNGRQNN